MEFDPDDLDSTMCYKLLIGSIVPRPIGWASTLSRDGIPNLAPFSFFTCVCRKPPMVSLTIQPKSDRLYEKDTLINIRETGEFVVNTVSLANANPMHASSKEFPPEVDEFVEVGLEKAPSHVVKPLRVASAPIAMECRVDRLLSMGDVGDHLVIGRVVRFHVAEKVMVQTGRIDTALLQPVGRLAGEYVLLEKMFACPVPDETLARHAGPMYRIDEKETGWSPLDEKDWSAAGNAKAT